MFAAIALEEIVRFIIQVGHDFLAVLLGYRDTGLLFRLLAMRLLARPFRIAFRKKVLDFLFRQFFDERHHHTPFPNALRISVHSAAISSALCI